MRDPFTNNKQRWEWMKAHGLEEDTMALIKAFGKPVRVSCFPKDPQEVDRIQTEQHLRSEKACATAMEKIRNVVG